MSLALVLAAACLLTDAVEGSIHSGESKTVEGAVDAAKPQAAVIINGAARNRVTYHLRAPADYDAAKSYPAIVILHGSNMNSKAYIDTIVGQWPQLAERYLLIGINGELRNDKSPPDNPTYNYTYVNFVGKSKYKGFPGTDRESPALVAEVLEELKGRLNIGKLFVGGHSQGGFLTYSVLMNYPDLIDGAFPVSAGLIIQCEPTAYDDQKVCQAQRRVPLVIVHGSTDTVVGYGAAQFAHEAFEDAGFPALRLMAHETAGHRFAFLPIDEAIEWLEWLTSDDPSALLECARASIEAEQFRDACAALHRLQALTGQEAVDSEALALRSRIETLAQAEADRLRAAIESSKSGAWVDDFMIFRHRFGLTEAATPLLEAYMKLRQQHQPHADELFGQARQAFGSGDQEGGYEKYRQIVDRYYASGWRQLAKRALEQRPPTSHN